MRRKTLAEITSAFTSMEYRLGESDCISVLTTLAEAYGLDVYTGLDGGFEGLTHENWRSKYPEIWRANPRTAQAKFRRYVQRVAEAVPESKRMPCDIVFLYDTWSNESMWGIDAGNGNVMMISQLQSFFLVSLAERFRIRGVYRLKKRS